MIRFKAITEFTLEPVSVEIFLPCEYHAVTTDQPNGVLCYDNVGGEEVSWYAVFEGKRIAQGQTRDGEVVLVVDESLRSARVKSHRFH